MVSNKEKEEAHIGKAVETCLGAEDPFVCAKKVLVQYKDADCGPKLVLLVQPNCIPCKEAQERFAKDIDENVIKKVEVGSAEGIEIIKKNEIKNVPSLLVLDCHNKSIV